MDPEPQASRPSHRRGWGWTLLKCLILTVALAVLGAGVLHWLLHSLQPPWFIPRGVYEWVMEHIRPWALAVGAVAGTVVGFVSSIGVIVWDARKGRLTRVK